MPKCFLLTTMLCAAFSAAACSATTASHPCDLLVKMEPQPATARYLVDNDKPFARAVAGHRARFERYKCR